MKRPILYILIPFCLGILSCESLNIPFIYPFILSISLLALALVFAPHRVQSHIYLYSFIFFFGVVWYHNACLLPPEHIRNFSAAEPKRVTIKGMITDDPTISKTFYHTERTRFLIKADSLRLSRGWQRVSGLVRVDLYSYKGKPLSFGDEVILEGMLSEPVSLRNPGVFDYSKYLGIRNIYSTLKVRENFYVEIAGRGKVSLIEKISYGIRKKARNEIDSYFTEPYKGFLKAILIGDRSGIGDEPEEDFVKTGTVHILAISGLHVGMIAGMMLLLFGLLRIPRRSGLVLTAVILVLYAFVAGGKAPIVRAVIIFSIFVIGYLMNRQADMLNSLSCAAFLILLWNPKEMFGPSFQLSFLSLSSIVILTPRIDKILGIDSAVMKKGIPARSRRYLLKGVSVSVAAWIGTWPLTALYFNIVSPVAIIANLVVIPMLSIILALTFIFMAVNPISNFLALSMAQTISVTGDILFSVNRCLSQLPWAYFRIGSPSISFSIFYYLSVAFLLSISGAWSQRVRRYRGNMILALLILCNVAVWNEVAVNSKEALKITFLDVGQGDSMFIELPRGGRFLIDGGSGGEKERFDMGRSVIAPYLWNRGVSFLDGVILTHFHADHLGGAIYILKNFKVGYVIDNGAIGDSRLYRDYLSTVKEKGINRIIVGEGDVLAFSDEAKLFVLNPQKGAGIHDSNDNSLVLKLVYKYFSALFCGDITEKSVERISEDYGEFLKSDIMKIPHHGGVVSDENFRIFFDYVAPETSVISVGRANRYRAPSKNIVKIITSSASRSYVTKSDGAITVVFDASHKKYTVKIHRNIQGDNLYK